jgi:hypothetical protein
LWTPRKAKLSLETDVNQNLKIWPFWPSLLISANTNTCVGSFVGGGFLVGRERLLIDSEDSRSGRKKLSMEVYERETEEIVKRFLARRISFPDCIAALDAALAGLIPTLTGDQITRLRIVMLANNEIVMKEMERRG